MSFHRVVKGFVIQSGHLPTRGPLGETQQKYVRQMKAEFNDQLHDKGTLSMARLAEPDSASTSFFIVTASAQALDGQYTAFGKVESGLDVVEKIEAVAVNGETPVDARRAEESDGRETIGARCRPSHRAGLPAGAPSALGSEGWTISRNWLVRGVIARLSTMATAIAHS